MRALSPDDERWPWLIGLFALLVPAAILWGSFVNDAVVAIERSPCVRGDVSLVELFTRDFWCEPSPQSIRSWRPLPVLLWRWIWQVASHAPLSPTIVTAGVPGSPVSWPFALASLVVHGLVTVALVRLCATIGVDRRRALVAAVIFGSLGIHVDLVASLVGLAGLMSAMATLFFLCDAMSTSHQQRPFRAGVWYLVAVLSHESGVLALPVLLVACLLRYRRPSDLQLRGSWSVLGVAVAITALYLPLRTHVVGTVGAEGVYWYVNPMVQLNLVDRALDACGMIFRYVKLTIVPGPFSVDYAFDAIPVGEHRDWGPVLTGGTLIVAALVISLRPRTPATTSWLLLWLLGAAVFVSNGPFVLPALFAERMFYAATIPASVLMGMLAWPPGDASRWRRRLQTAMLAAFVVVQAGASIVAAARWTDAQILYTTSLEAAPRNARLLEFSARTHLKRDQPAEAIRRLDACLEIQPGRPTALALRGASLDMLGEPELALTNLKEAFEADPSRPEASDLFVQFLLRYGHRRQAKIVFERHRVASGGTPHPDVTRP